MFSEVLNWQESVPKKAYEDANKCAVCMCELFPDPFAETRIE